MRYEILTGRDTGVIAGGTLAGVSGPALGADALATVADAVVRTRAEQLLVTVTREVVTLAEVALHLLPCGGITCQLTKEQVY